MLHYLALNQPQPIRLTSHDLAKALSTNIRFLVILILLTLTAFSLSVVLITIMMNDDAQMQNVYNPKFRKYLLYADGEVFLDKTYLWSEINAGTMDVVGEVYLWSPL